MSNIQPHPGNNHPKTPPPSGNHDLAAEIIRKKLDSIYGEEPSARLEREEVKNIAHPSKHQRFMQELSQSGKSLAQIQTEWHNYYVALSDKEKHQVWEEFYKESARLRAAPQPSTPPTPQPKSPNSAAGKKSSKSRTVSQVKQQLLKQINTKGKLSKKHHLQSVFFGLAAGAVTILILMFSFFNERVVAPFITPSRAVTDTPIIVDTASQVSGEPKVIIPKINVEIPVVYDAPDIQEATIQAALERGVVHYPTTPMPGEMGNVAIFGHSSNNILNPGAYKFAFVLLNRLEEGDTFMLTKDGKRYVYRVYKKHIVKPTDVGVLNTQEKPATATLITCDPPGTTINRLVVVGEQISPDPATNGESTAIQTDQQPTIVPGNAPSLWQRLREWLTS